MAELQVSKYTIRSSGTRIAFRRFDVSHDTPQVSSILLANFAEFRGWMGERKYAEKILAHYAPDSFPRLAAERDYRVITIDGKVVGVIGFKDGTMGMRSELLNLSTHKAFQKMGIATLVILLGLLERINAGFQYFHADISLASRDLFRRLGFSETNTCSYVSGESSYLVSLAVDESKIRHLRMLLAEAYDPITD